MLIKNIRPYNFRNLVISEVLFSPNLNLIVGPNGQGKTSILEAVYVLVSTKSFRATKSEEFITWGKDSGSVFGLFGNFDSEFELGVIVDGRKKQLLFNGNKLSSAGEFVSKAVAVSFTPEDLALVRGTPSQRRRFLDKHLVDLKPHFFSTLLAYQRALGSKLKLLKDEATTPADLEPWNRILADEGMKIVEARRMLVKKLEAFAGKIVARLSADNEQLNLSLKETFLGIRSADEAFDKLVDYSIRELSSRMALLGPHRDDLLINLEGKPAAAYASQGQARSVVIALLTAVVELIELERFVSPVLLLDDVGSELDEARTRELLALIQGHSRQTLITGTDIWLKDLVSESARLINVEGGRVS